jgi:hypothetical protein
VIDQAHGTAKSQRVSFAGHPHLNQRQNHLSDDSSISLPNLNYDADVCRQVQDELHLLATLAVVVVSPTSRQTRVRFQ